MYTSINFSHLFNRFFYSNQVIFRFSFKRSLWNDSFNNNNKNHITLQLFSLLPFEWKANKQKLNANSLQLFAAFPALTLLFLLLLLKNFSVCSRFLLERVWLLLIFGVWFRGKVKTHFIHTQRPYTTVFWIGSVSVYFALFKVRTCHIKKWLSINLWSLEVCSIYVWFRIFFITFSLKLLDF